MNPGAQNVRDEGQWWTRLAAVELTERRERFVTTTPGQRIRQACELSEFGRRIRAGMTRIPR
jgi:hypothetical protein